MAIREKLKKFALNHNGLLTVYRATFGKLKTKLYFGMQRRSLQKNGFSMIEQIDDVLTRAGARYFVDCGTLLGMVRDNKPIEHDRDMDYGIWFDEKFGSEDLDRAMESLGFKKVSEGRFHDKAEELTYARGVIHIDFFNHTEIGNESWLYVFYRDPECTYPSKEHCSVIIQKRLHITGLKRIDVNGIKMMIPENVEPYLASAYTEDWRIPNPDWRYTMEPGCNYVKDEFGIKKEY